MIIIQKALRREFTLLPRIMGAVGHSTSHQQRLSVAGILPSVRKAVVMVSAQALSP